LSSPLGPLGPAESLNQTGILLNLGAPDGGVHTLSLVADSGWNYEPEVDELYYRKPGEGYNNNRTVSIRFCDFFPLLTAQGSVTFNGKPADSMIVKEKFCILEEDMLDIGTNAKVTFLVFPRSRQCANALQPVRGNILLTEGRNAVGEHLRLFGRYISLLRKLFRLRFERLVSAQRVSITNRSVNRCRV